MARIILSSGEINDSEIGGSSLNEVFGANGNEEITIKAGGRAILDASFNRGGDTVNLLGTAASYDVVRSGSSIVLTDGLGGTITIPVGTVGATISFAGDDRTLVFDTTTGQILLDGQIVTTTIADVEAGAPSGSEFVLTPETAAGADVMRLTGSAAVRIDFTRNDNQVVGLDKNGNGVIDIDGSENVDPITADDNTKFEIVDAYARNKSNEGDTSANYLGDIRYDGVGFGGDGVNTNGNIFLGGLGADIAIGGIGNDFLAGGGVASSRGGGNDRLDGGRNADFFFAELSLLDNTDGNGLVINGGSTTDDSAVGNNTPQDSDWLLIEVGDDEDGTLIDLDNSGPGSEVLLVTTGAGQRMTGTEIENVDASGNLYGFLNDFAGTDLELGDGGAANLNGEYQGIGSSAQLRILGSIANNILIGGYDNDRIEGRDGNDTLLGGNLNYSLFNPNSVGIVNDGRDELIGGAGDDNLVFEVDGGIYNGGSLTDTPSGEDDTLYLTSLTLGARTADQLTTDGVLRFDLGVGGGSGAAGGINAFAGYGGADKATSVGYTADQTNYAAGVARSTTQDIENVITTGLGDIDFLAAGTNNPELVFNNQQNFLAYNGDLDVRGTNADNIIYLGAGSDVIEGREGDDFLSGGDSNDDFLFDLGGGDDIDVIWRQQDANNDNLWDRDAEGNGLYERDFGVGNTSTTGPSSLTIDFAAANLADANVFINSFSVEIGGITFEVTDTAALAAATTVAQLATLANAAFSAQDSNVTVTANGTLLTITDSTPTGGRDISDLPVEGYDVAITVIAPGTGTLGLPIFTAPGTSTADDRLIFVAYEDRADNERVDDDITIGADSLGGDAYANDLVVNFNRDGSTAIAEDQSFRIELNNLAVEDVVTVTVNGVDFTLQVGRQLDGSLIAGETTEAFAERLAAYITNYLDDDTAAGKVNAAYLANSPINDGTSVEPDSDTGVIVLTQNAYTDGEETVFMVVSADVNDNSSNGEGAQVTVINESQTDITLYEFDGRNGELNAGNVLFVGDTGTSRSVLQTALAAGGTLVGSDAIVANVTGDLAINSSATGANGGIGGAAIQFNATKNPTTGETSNFAVHGDDQLFGGAGNDTISAGTGDDRVYGSLGTDRIDGGRDLYLVDGQIRVLNKAEAAAIDALPATIDIRLLGDKNNNGSNVDEVGSGQQSSSFVDTLILQQADIGAAAFFTITLDLTSAQLNGGAGEVITNGLAANQTLFTNFENIRTVSGNGTLAGQGNDTLDLSQSVNPLTGVKALNGFNMEYLLTAAPAGGQVYLDRNDNGIFELSELVISVDGVENVLLGSGDDTVVIDQTEAGKNNRIEGGLGADTVTYSFFIDVDGDGVDTLADNVANPAITLTVNAAANTDTVASQGGILPAGDVPVDTLVSIETINFGDSLDNPTLDDTLDVTNVTNAVVDYVAGQVRSGGLGSSTVEVKIGGITGFEVVEADFNDTVIVADRAVMDDNVRANVAPATDVTFDSFLTYDFLDERAATPGSPVRLTIADTRTITAGTANTADSGDIPDAVNVGLFQFNLGANTDRVDYSNETGNIAVSPNLTVSSFDFNVLVLGGDLDLDDAGDRVDQVTGVEQVVASQGESIIDLTASLTAGGDYANRNVVITYQSQADASLVNVYDPTAGANGTVFNNARREFTVLLEDADTTTPFNTLRFIEYRDANGADAYNAPTASWNRIEGSDGNETVQFTSAQEDIEHTLNLRGGSNAVYYNLQTNGVEVTVDSITGGVTDLSIEALASDGSGRGIFDDVTSYNSQNEVATGDLTIIGSTLFRDTINLGNSGVSTLYSLGNLATGGVAMVDVTFDTDSDGSFDDNEVGLTLIGFEVLQDGATDDTYEIVDLSNFFDNFRDVIDAAGDTDTLLLQDNALENDSLNGFNVTWADGSIELDDFENAVASGGFDFDILDISQLTEAVDVVDTNDAGETVILGSMNLIGDENDAFVDVQGFQTVVFTAASAATLTSSVVIDQTLGEFRTSGGGELFTFDSATVFDFSDVTGGGRTVDIIGAVGTTVVGTAGADTISGDQGNDVITGGAGADTLSGGFVAEVQEVHTFVLAGSWAPGTADSDVTINGFTIQEGDNVQGIVVPDGADADQIGAAFVREWQNNPTSFTDNAIIQSITYDATTNALTVTFVPGVNPPANELGNPTQTAGTDANTFVAGPETTTTAFAAQADSADTFIYNLASDSTSTATDQITDFTVVNGVRDVIDLSAIVAPGDADIAVENNDFASFADIVTAANTFFGGGFEGYVASDGTNSFVLYDADNNGTYNAGSDLLIQLNGLNGADLNNLTTANFAGDTSTTVF